MILVVGLDVSWRLSGNSKAFQLEIPGLNPGCDGGYVPLMRSNNSETLELPEFNVSQIYTWKMESERQPARLKNIVSAK